MPPFAEPAQSLLLVTKPLLTVLGTGCITVDDLRRDVDRADSCTRTLDDFEAGARTLLISPEVNPLSSTAAWMRDGALSDVATRVRHVKWTVDYSDVLSIGT